MTAAPVDSVSAPVPPAADAARLERVYERLGSQVATERQEREVTGMVAGGALVLVAGAALASLRWFGRFV